MSPQHPASRAAIIAARRLRSCSGAEALQGLEGLLGQLFSARLEGEALHLDACGAHAAILLDGGAGDLLHRFPRADAHALRFAIRSAPEAAAVTAWANAHHAQKRIELCFAPFHADQGAKAALIGSAAVLGPHLPTTRRRSPDFPLRLIALGHVGGRAPPLRLVPSSSA
jgi:hypothetical protein